MFWFLTPCSPCPLRANLFRREPPSAKHKRKNFRHSTIQIEGNFPADVDEFIECPGHKLVLDDGDPMLSGHRTNPFREVTGALRDDDGCRHVRRVIFKRDGK